MNQTNSTTGGNEANEKDLSEETTARMPEPANCCGPEAGDMMQTCACASFMKKHPLAGLGVLLVMLSMFLISQVGGILGIIAFFRTM